jgi:Sec-independent protein translocase protein TatA
MDFLGIGPLELIMIFIIILLVLGPTDMIKAGRTIGNFIRKLSTSDSWRAVQRARKEMRTLPNKLAREAGLEDLTEAGREIQNFKPDLISPASDAWVKKPTDNHPDPTEENQPEQIQSNQPSTPMEPSHTEKEDNDQ